MIPARYYDGRRARSHDVRLRAEGELLLIDTPDGVPLANWPLREIERAGSWEGRGPFALTCRTGPDARLILADARSAEAIRGLAPQLSEVDRRDRRRAFRMVALGVVAAVLTVALVYEGAPRWLAAAIPSSWLAPLGDSLLEGLKEGHSLCTDGEGRLRLERLANRLAASAGHHGHIRVDLLDWNEVNAFALPGDRIVILKGILRSGDAGELAGVLAHEVGHVVNRHVNEAVVRALGIQFLLTFFTGTGDFASAAAVLTSLGYSRAAEAQADRFAVEALRAEGFQVAGLRRFFQRLALEGEGEIIPSWLSTHPRSADRAAAIPDDPAGVDAFTPAELLAIRAACQ